MEQPDQAINDNLELITNPAVQIKPEAYNKAMLVKLYIEDGLTAVEIAELYEQKYDVNRIKNDIKKWQLNTKFFTNHSITQKLDIKYDHYSSMIKAYAGANKFQAKYRELTDVVAELRKLMDALKNVLAQDNSGDIDSKAILATVESIMKTSRIDVVEVIKIQQKDQDTMIKLNAMQDQILDKLMDARELEMKQVDIEKILNAIYGETKVLETKTGMVGLAHNFRMNLRKTILKVTGSKSSILGENREPDNGVKINALQLQSVNKIMTEKGVSRKIAWAVLKATTENPNLNMDELIQKLIKEENELKTDS